MVYKIEKLSTKAFLAILLFIISLSLIVFASGWAIISVAVTFDSLSFNPSLADANNISDSNIFCPAYSSSDCDWFTYNDLISNKENKINLLHYEKILNLTNAFNLNKVIAVNSTKTKAIFLLQSTFKINFALKIENSTLININQTALANFNSNSILCLDFNLQKGNGCAMTIEPQIKIYKNSSIACIINSEHCLVPAIPILSRFSDDKVLCNNYFINCDYRPEESFLRDLEQGSYVNSKTGEKTIAYGSLEKTGFLIDQSISNTICSLKTLNTFPHCSEVELNTVSLKNSFTFKLLDGVTYGIGNINFLNVLENSNIKYISEFSQYSKTNEICQYSPITSNIYEFNEISSIQCLNGDNYNFLKESIFSSYSLNEPILVFSLDQNNNLLVAIAMKIQNNANQFFQVLFIIIANPNIIIKTFIKSLQITNLFLFSLLFLFLGLILGFLTAFFRIWKIPAYFSPKIANLLKGKLGRLLELTQFFDLEGDWYLENAAIHTYDFKNIRSSIKEIVFNRWKNTFFMPPALTATIGVLIVSLTNPANYVFTLIVSPLMPIILLFWLPIIWTIEDSGLKTVEWESTGEIVSLHRISKTLDEGFHKLIGFSAVFGIGTAGSNAFREQIGGNNFASIELNFNYIISVLLWTIGLFLLMCAISLTGITIVSVFYLSRHHLASIRIFREKMQEKGVFFGTTQQFFDHRSEDTAIYHSRRIKAEKLENT
jgi:hypothetical protein